MADLLEEILKSHGPCLSTNLARILVESHGSTPAAARKRVSRGENNVRHLGYIKFPRNARFVYLQQDFGSPQYWEQLIKALLETKSAYGLALAALRQRGGIMPEKHFPIACGAPIRQAKHLAPETIFQRLQQANLVEKYDIPGVGTCIALIQGPDRYDIATDEINARLITEGILLQAVRMWIKNLGLGSYNKVDLRDDGETPPKVSTFAWDLTAPSYLGPMVGGVTNTGKQKPGFIVCDVLLGVEVDEAGLQPFIYKSTTLRSLVKVGRCLQIFVADRYTAEAFALAKKKGIVPATPESLFGSEIAQGLALLTTALVDTASFAANPEVFNEVFSRLTKIEGAANNLRGALFEFIAAELARREISQDITMNRVLKDENGAKVEIDVIAKRDRRSVHFIECKGYAPFATIPDELVEKWLNDRVPLVHKLARSHSDWKSLELHFEFWTTGKLTPESIAMIDLAKSKARKYSVEYRDAAMLRTLARETKDSGLLKTLEQHFIGHPMATAEVAVSRRSVSAARSLASKETGYLKSDQIFKESEGHNRSEQDDVF